MKPGVEVNMTLYEHVSRRRKVPTKSGSMLDKKIVSVRKVFYLRAGALDVIFSVGFGHILSKIFRSLGCLE